MRLRQLSASHSVLPRVPTFPLLITAPSSGNQPRPAPVDGLGAQKAAPGGVGGDSRCPQPLRQIETECPARLCGGG